MKVEIPKQIKQKSVYFKQYTIIDLGIAIMPLMFIFNSYKHIHNWKIVTLLSIPLIIIIIWLLLPSGNGRKRNYEIISKMWNHVYNYLNSNEDFVVNRKLIKKNIMRKEKNACKKELRKKGSN